MPRISLSFQPEVYKSRVVRVCSATLRDEVAQQTTDNAVKKRVPLAKYIRAEVQSRLKPVGSKVFCVPYMDKGIW